MATAALHRNSCRASSLDSVDSRPLHHCTGPAWKEHERAYDSILRAPQLVVGLQHLSLQRCKPCPRSEDCAGIYLSGVYFHLFSHHNARISHAFTTIFSSTPSPLPTSWSMLPTPTRIHMYANIHCMYASMYVCSHIYYMYSYMYVCLCTCVCICVHLCTYISSYT